MIILLYVCFFVCACINDCTRERYLMLHGEEEEEKKEEEEKGEEKDEGEKKEEERNRKRREK